MLELFTGCSVRFSNYWENFGIRNFGQNIYPGSKRTKRETGISKVAPKLSLSYFRQEKSREIFDMPYPLSNNTFIR